MNATITALKAQLQSTRNAVRDESRMKLAALVMLLINIGLTWWGIARLRISIQQWQTQGTTTQHLLQLCLMSYIGVALLTAVGSIQRMLDSDEALVLFTLPLTLAARFRVLYCTILISNMWSWMLLEAIVSSYTLVPLLGWHTLEWIALLELGAMFAVLCAIIAVLCVIRYMLASRHWTLWFVFIVCIIAIEAILTLLASHKQEFLIATDGVHIGWFIVAYGVVLLLALGPCANIPGSLYVQALLVTQRWDRSRRLFTLPGIPLIVNMLESRRMLMSALLTKMLLSQSRNPFAWLRIGILVLIGVLFVPLHTLALHAGWSNMLFVAVYAAVLGIVPVVEQAPSAINGEANRLTLYMVAPFDISRLLRLRLLQFLLVSVSIGLIASLVCSWQLHLTLGQLIVVIGVMVLLVTATLMVMVCGSAWDEDINLAVEGALQTIMQEEGPMTPKRMGVFNLGIAVFVGMVIVLWKEQMAMVLPVMMVVDVGLVFGMWRLGCMGLRKIVRV